MKNSTDLEVKVEKNKRTTKDVLAALTAFFGLMYIFLALIGYGVSLAFESIFNIPHSQLYESPFELIDLSSLAVVQLVFGATEIIDRSLPLLKNMYSRSYGLILFAVILSVAKKIFRGKENFYVSEFEFSSQGFVDWFGGSFATASSDAAANYGVRIHNIYPIQFYVGGPVSGEVLHTEMGYR
jgi:hypothetical protein